jgi:type II secretory ATPase GspE/PulE/Tfp pilus assembly ATPase PilB-like protein
LYCFAIAFIAERRLTQDGRIRLAVRGLPQGHDFNSPPRLSV